jgi:hypothetical protein
MLVVVVVAYKARTKPKALVALEAVALAQGQSLQKML